MVLNSSFDENVNWNIMLLETIGKCLYAYQRLLSNIIRISYSMCMFVRVWVMWSRVKLLWVFRNVKLLSIFFLYFVIIPHFASLVTFLSENDLTGCCSRILLYICTIKILAVSGRRAGKWATNRPVYWTWRIRNKHQWCLFRVDQVQKIYKPSCVILELHGTRVKCCTMCAVKSIYFVVFPFCIFLHFPSLWKLSLQSFGNE